MVFWETCKYKTLEHTGFDLWATQLSDLLKITAVVAELKLLQVCSACGPGQQWMAQYKIVNLLKAF